MIETFKLTLLIICLCQIKIIFATQSIGDNCKLKNNQSGKCVLLKNCPIALTQVQQGKTPEICFFQNVDPIICCPDELKEEIVSTNTTNTSNTDERISRKKCREYSQSVYELVDAPIILAEQMNMKVNVSKCNIPRGILTTEIAMPKEFPHMALIEYEPDHDKNPWLCSGVLISEQFVLTTGRCSQTYNGTPQKVRLGITHVKSELINKKYIDVKVSEIIRHPDLKRPQIYNDIALLKLQNPVEFNEYIRPACLPDLNQNTTKRNLLTGWESLSTSISTVDALYKYIVEKKSEEECNETYNHLSRTGRWLPNGFNANLQICTKLAYGGCEVLLLGSPIQTYDSELHCMYNIQGILSHGNNCMPNSYEIYTKIASYIDWIEKIVWS